MEPTHVRLTIPDSIDPNELMGPADALLRRVEGAFDAMVAVRGNHISLTGEADEVELATSVFSRMIRLVEAGDGLTTDDVDLLIDRVRHGAQRMDVLADDVLLTFRGRAIRPKTAGQKRYVDSIRKNLVTFGIGPAGTGKTYLAVALAAFYLKNREVERIILTRPAVEAGEKLGFLPGDLQEKIDPYLRPLYDALADMFGYDQFQKMIDRNIIEVAPLAYMRGRTLEESFIILDEAQNTTREQMKMFLTRMGNHSRVVVNGDATQIDLVDRRMSGLTEAEKILKDVRGVGMVYFSDEDVVRHDMVGRIIRAYETYYKQDH